MGRTTMKLLYLFYFLLYNLPMKNIDSKTKYYKVGRVYWIKPKPIPGMQSKVRPAIVLEKYDNGKTIFIHLGSTEYKEKSSIAANHMLWKDMGSAPLRRGGNVHDTFIHLDPSKPEWNTSVIKPHVVNGKYTDIDNKTMKKIRGIYHMRKTELSEIRMRRAKISIIQGNEKEALKQLKMLKDKDPIIHKGLEPTKWIKTFMNKI